MKKINLIFLCMVGTSALWSMDQDESSDHPRLTRKTSFLRKFFEKRNKKNQKSIKTIQANKTNPAKKIVAENETLEEFCWLNSTMRKSTTLSPEIADMLQEQADKLKKQKSPFFHRKKQSDEDSDEE